ncbi:MAG: hypothetical protein U9O94_10730 [Nanoarchaeota archaeon]|nr:hypothetical protein [Nanoarchaeota archaeon]
MELCPRCESIEIESNTPRTVYHCGSSDYDQRPNTFKQTKKCRRLEKKRARVLLEELKPIKSLNNKLYD